MDLEILSTKEELLEAQLKIIRLQKKKANFVRDKDYEKSSSIQDQIVDAENLIRDLVQRNRQYIDSNSVLQNTDLLCIIAPLETEYKNLILEKELVKKQDHLKEFKTISVQSNVKIKNKIEIVRQKNQLLQLFIQGELLLKQWTEYHHFQRESLSPHEYINLIKLKYQSLDLFPEFNTVYCFYGNGKELSNQIKAKFSSRSSIFNPILKVLIQFGSKASIKLPFQDEEDILNLLKEFFNETPLFIDGKYKNINAADKTFLYITIKPDFSPLNIVGAF